METESNDAPQVETAPAPQDQTSAPAAPASTESSAVETPSLSPSEALAAAEADLKSFYEPPVQAEAGTEEKTQEQAPEQAPAPTKGDPKAEPPSAEKPAEVKTPPAESGDGDLPKQIRPRLSDPVDLAIAGIQRAQNCTFADAAKMYFAATATAAAPAPNGEQPTQAAPASPTQALETQIATLAAEIKAERESDGYMLPAHQEKMERLADLRGDLKLAKFQEGQQAQVQQQSQAQQAERAVDASFLAARTEFPAISDTASPLRQAVAAVEAEWASNPTTAGRLARTDTPQMLVREAAERVAADLVTTGKFRTIDLALASLKAAPATPVAPVAVAALQTTTPPAAQPRRVTPAPGFKGQLSGNQPSSLAQATADATTAKEANALMEQFYGKAPLML